MTIVYNEDNASFEDLGTIEHLMILKKIGEKLEQGKEGGFIFDDNGNKIGAWEKQSDGESDNPWETFRK